MKIPMKKLKTYDFGKRLIIKRQIYKKYFELGILNEFVQSGIRNLNLNELRQIREKL